MCDTALKVELKVTLGVFCWEKKRETARHRRCFLKVIKYLFNSWPNINNDPQEKSCIQAILHLSLLFELHFLHSYLLIRCKLKKNAGKLNQSNEQEVQAWKKGERMTILFLLCLFSFSLGSYSLTPSLSFCHHLPVCLCWNSFSFLRTFCNVVCLCLFLHECDSPATSHTVRELSLLCAPEGPALLTDRVLRIPAKVWALALPALTDAT